jgi:hypothetical protein
MAEIDQPSARLRLAAELAVGLARRLWMALGAEASDAGFCWHYAQNPFEDACHVLWQLGVALSGIEGGDQGITWQQSVEHSRQYPGEKDIAGAVFKFFPAAETRAGVLAHGELPDALFARLLAAYIGNACEQGPDGTQLGSGQEPFEPMAEFEREIAALVACGYAERRGDMVKWTEKIAPVMRQESCWDEPTPQVVTLPYGVLERVNDLLEERNPIGAMALVRQKTGLSFFECKAYVDGLVQKSRRGE